MQITPNSCGTPFTTVINAQGNNTVTVNDSDFEIYSGNGFVLPSTTTTYINDSKIYGSVINAFDIEGDAIIENSQLSGNTALYVGVNSTVKGVNNQIDGLIQNLGVVNLLNSYDADYNPVAIP